MMNTVGEPDPWQFRYRLRPGAISTSPEKSASAAAVAHPVRPMAAVSTAVAARFKITMRSPYSGVACLVRASAGNP